MKTNNATKADKTVIEQLREIRDKLSMDIKDLSLADLKEYINKQKTLHPENVWQKNK
ncbi:MAG TPA: hypothetical protein VGN20_03885 [Mucilaginibacter sp.]|jgi:hypothetical protein